MRKIIYTNVFPEPDSTDYDVNLTSGIDYINVTWNEVNNNVIEISTLSSTFHTVQKKKIIHFLKKVYS